MTMVSRLCFFRTLLVLSTLTASYTSVFAECGPRAEMACAMVNNDDEVFVARVLAPVPDNPFEWRVRVVRLFRGSASGEITVWVHSHGDLPSPANLTVGQSYLFYTSLRQDQDGRPIRTTPLCSTWLPLNAVSRDEINFLANLRSRRDDGRILGVLVQ